MKQLAAQQPSRILSVTAILRIMLHLLLAFIFLTFVRPASHAQDHPRKNILVLNSYHKGLSWTDSIIDGIESVLKTPGQGITERCVFSLSHEGMELIETAPGVDIEEDILPWMDFKPIMKIHPI